LCPPTGPAWGWHSAILQAFCPEPAAAPGEDTYVTPQKQEKKLASLSAMADMGMIAMLHRMPRSCARYAPKDVQVSSIVAYTRLTGTKYRLAKPLTLQENEDLLLRLDTLEPAPQTSGVKEIQRMLQG